MSVIALLVIGLLCNLQYSCGDVVFNMTQLSSPRDGVSLLEVGSDLYFVGGLEFHTAITTDIIEIFDLKNRTWKEPIKLPTKRAFVTPVVIEPHIYFVGGYDYPNPPYIYDDQQKMLRSDYGSGPTVTVPDSISLHESMLTVLGTYSVDFFDLNTKNWSYSAELTRIKMNLIDSVFFTHEDIVVIIGGTNVTSDEPITSAWIYNRTTDVLEEFPQALNTPTSFSTFNFFVMNGVISAWGSGYVILHKLGTPNWHQLNMDTSVITSIASSQTLTFIFVNGGYSTFNWLDNSLSELTYEAGMIYQFTVDGYVCYLSSMFRSSAANYYNDTSGQWNFVPISLQFSNIQRQAVNGQYICMASSSEVYVVNIRIGILAALSGFNEIVEIFPGNNSFHVIDKSDQTQRFVIQLDEFFSRSDEEIINTRSLPVAVIGDTFFTANGGAAYGNVTLATYNQLVDLGDSVLWQANDKHFVIMERIKTPTTNLRNFYAKVDIYDLEAAQWQNSTNLPFEGKDDAPMWYLPATALGGKLVVWKDTHMAIYDPETALWLPVIDNGTLSDSPNDKPGLINAHVPVLTLNDTAYLRGATSFAVFKAKSLEDWTTTVSADLGFFAQYFALDEDRIVITHTQQSEEKSTFFERIFTYDRKRDYLDISLLPEPTQYFTLVPVGPFLVGFAYTTSMIYYYEIASGQWFKQPYNSSVMPSAVYQTSQQLSVVVGGRLVPVQRELYSDRVLLFDHGSITIPPASPAANETVSPPVSGLIDGELAVAIVVPIAVALLAGALLLILLLRKKRKQKRARGSSTTTGLATLYGQWFIPFDQIKFGEQIGRGASGQVFKGSWKGSSVALKVSMTQANSTIIGELELMMQMRPHPNVVQLFGFSVHPETDSIILAIEFCDGGSLDDVLFESTAPISLEQKTALLLGIASGLNHLHANNIVHRDVASRNVLIHKNDAKLTDFGMSRLIDEDTQRGTTKSELGPIRWMAPESLKIKEYSVKSDVWSFGVLMYEIVAQIEPHSDADPIEIGRLIRDKGVTPVIPDTCPTAFADIMKSCWNMNADKRPSIEEILMQLENLNK